MTNENPQENPKKSFSLCPCKIWENVKLYPKSFVFFLVFCFAVFILDQSVKDLILSGFRYEGRMISIVYVLNEGVAFSLFAFLGEWLKWIQLIFVVVLGYAVLLSRDLWLEHMLSFALILGSGVSNLYDRFEMGGVVDYIYWHYGFDFAIFNLADVFINVGAGIFLLKIVFEKRRASV